jgi:hypothetical protein
MPSDDRLRLALDAVSGQIATFRSAVTVAAERVRAMLAVGGGAERARVELGSLGAARIDVTRFAELSRGVAIDASTRELVAQAADILGAIADVPESAFVVPVPAGERAAERITNVLTEFGRAFGAVRAVDLVRSGRFAAVKREDLSLAYRPDRWTSAERSAAPPIVAVVNGADIHAGELAELLDGSQHLVLVVEGACPPASLVRLITPNTFVLQTADGRGLDRFRDYRGPAVAAFVDDEAACFSHDPTRGGASWQRLEIWRQPALLPRKRIDGSSSRQQAEEVGQLAVLAARPEYSASKLGDLVPTGTESVDRLTEWLLVESGLMQAEQ